MGKAKEAPRNFSNLTRNGNTLRVTLNYFFKKPFGFTRYFYQNNFPIFFHFNFFVIKD